MDQQQQQQGQLVVQVVEGWATAVVAAYQAPGAQALVAAAAPQATLVGPHLVQVSGGSRTWWYMMCVWGGGVIVRIRRLKRACSGLLFQRPGQQVANSCGDWGTGRFGKRSSTATGGRCEQPGGRAGGGGGGEG